MRPETFPIAAPLPEIVAAAAAEAEVNDATGGFPGLAFTQLRALDVTAHPPSAPGQAQALLWTLAAVGRGDLSVGRILEGHINVLLLIDRYGSETQRAHYRGLADTGALFGVWNTDAPGAALSECDGVFEGKKAFATGVDGLSHAIVTTAGPAGRQMFIAPLAGCPVDRSWWRPLGMRASGSHIVDFTAVPVAPDGRLGRPDDYVEQPWFAGGAMRFLAVQVGGMHAILDIAAAHLAQAGRGGDPYQRARLGQMAATVEGGYGWLRRCADSWSVAERRGEPDGDLVPTVNGARGAIERACLEVLDLAERSVGAAGLIAPHPLERRLRDLRTYLRQPNPDGALASFGDSVLAGTWAPGRLSA